MSVKSFKITGIFKNNKADYQNFVKNIRALKKEDAIEQIYRDIGSNHKAKRVNIKIKSIEEIEEQ